MEEEAGIIDDEEGGILDDEDTADVTDLEVVVMKGRLRLEEVVFVC